MKGLVVIGLWLAVVRGGAVGMEGEECPRVDPKDRTVLLPYPGDCSKFYKCLHGKRVPWDCPAGTHFNKNLSICDWPHKSGCRLGDPSGPAPTTPSPTTGPSHLWQCPAPSTKEPWRFMYPYPGDCTKFYMCSHGLAFVKDCPKGTHFNEKLSVCDWPYKAGCQEAQGTSAPPTTPPEGGDWKCPAKPPVNEPWRYMYPYQGDCTKFYMCSNGKAFVKDCPGGLHFNNKLSVCDWPKNSGCVQDHPAPPVNDEKVWQCPTKPPVNEPWRYMYAYPGDCTKFYMCSNGKAFVKVCPGGTYFNYKRSVCDWPQSSGCVQPSEDEVSPNVTLSGWTCPAQSKKEPWRFMYPHPQDCSKFYMCSHGAAFLKDCPPGTHFNDALMVCDWPKNAKCAVEPAPPATSVSGWQCPAPDSKEPWRYLYPVPEDCTRFYTCAHGRVFRRDCPQGLHFNNKLMVCDWPKNARCS